MKTACLVVAILASLVAMAGAVPSLLNVFATGLGMTITDIQFSRILLAACAVYWFGFFSGWTIHGAKEEAK